LVQCCPFDTPLDGMSDSIALSHNGSRRLNCSHKDHCMIYI
jgi:hypothetical protein